MFTLYIDFGLSTCRYFHSDDIVELMQLGWTSIGVSAHIHHDDTLIIVWSA